MEGVRVVLVKPGDVLVFGNIGDCDPETVAPAATLLKDVTGCSAVLFFNADIDMAAVPAAALAAREG